MTIHCGRKIEGECKIADLCLDAERSNEFVIELERGSGSVDVLAIEPYEISNFEDIGGVLSLCIVLFGVMLLSLLHVVLPSFMQRSELFKAFVYCRCLSFDVDD